MFCPFERYFTLTAPHAAQEGKRELTDCEGISVNEWWDELAIMANQHGNFGLDLTKKHCYLLLLTAVVGYHVLLSLLITLLSMSVEKFSKCNSCNQFFEQGNLVLSADNTRNWLQ